MRTLGETYIDLIYPGSRKRQDLLSKFGARGIRRWEKEESGKIKYRKEEGREWKRQEKRGEKWRIEECEAKNVHERMRKRRIGGNLREFGRNRNKEQGMKRAEAIEERWQGRDRRGRKRKWELLEIRMEEKERRNIREGEWEGMRREEVREGKRKAIDRKKRIVDGTRKCRIV